MKLKLIMTFSFIFKQGICIPSKMLAKIPSENDKIPGYIKRMGELGCYAIRATYGYENISIVRPANIYGPNDNFHSKNVIFGNEV